MDSSKLFQQIMWQRRMPWDALDRGTFMDMWASFASHLSKFSLNLAISVVWKWVQNRTDEENVCHYLFTNYITTGRKLVTLCNFDISQENWLLVPFFASRHVSLLSPATPHPHAFLISLPPLVQYDAFYDPLLVVSALMHA